MAGAESLFFQVICYGIVIVLSVGLCSCRKAISGEIAGHYSTSLPLQWGKATLVLHADGSFEEKAHFSDGREVQISGKWSFTGRSILRKPCLQISRTALSRTIEACSQATEAGLLGGVLIVIDTNDSLDYLKE
jgi:hypothetical protein